MTAVIDNLIARHGIEELCERLPGFLATQRWFGGGDRVITRVAIGDIIEINEADPTFLLVMADVSFTDGTARTYSVPVGIRDADHPMAEVNPRHRIGLIDNGRRIIYDALADNDCSFLLWQAMASSAEYIATRGTLRAHAHDLAPFDDGPSSIRMMPGEQSNTSLARGQDEFLKWSRRINPGPSVELEMIEALSAGGFTAMAETLGGIDYVRDGDVPTRIALLQRYLANATEGWAMALTSLRDLYAYAESRPQTQGDDRREIVLERGSSFVGETERLAEVTADMHAALASPQLSDDVRAVSITGTMLEDWANAMLGDVDAMLEHEDPRVVPLRARRDRLAQHIDCLRGIEPSGLATRIHGDFHLGQAVRTNAGWMLLDFEGEPARDVSERRERWSPLRDVAGMLRSLDYAAAATLAERTSPADPQWDELALLGDTWADINRSAYWDAYVARLRAAAPGLIPDLAAARTLCRAFEVHKALYEVGYELAHRPDWAAIPIRFLMQIAQ